jgi:hypothetical protein
MFSIIKNYKQKFSNESISIDALIEIVKNNPQKDLITQLRSIEYKSKDFISLKEKLSCITPHGLFSKIQNNGLIALSGYLYYDIDNFDTIKELDDTINKLINNYPIAFLQKSVSNKGFHFLIKYDTNIIANDTFSDLHRYVGSLLIKSGFNIDKNATGLVRRMIVSYDQGIYVNKMSILNIDLKAFKDFKESRKLEVSHKINKIKIITPRDTFNFDIIPLDILLTQIKIKTEYSKTINGDWCIDEIDSYHIIVPKTIKDGEKRKLYIRIINALYYLNSDITRQQIISYVYYINKHASPQMTFKELLKLTNYVCNTIETNGEVKINTRKKKIHFNKESNLSTKQKQSMAAKINAQLRKQKTMNEIKSAREELLKNNELETQKKVCDLTGFGIATIKRYWKYTNPLEKINYDYKDIKLSESPKALLDIDNSIDEKDFFK